MGRRARAHVSDVPRLLAIYSTKNALPPDEVAEWSNKTYWWECPEGPDHQWEATAATVSRSATAHGCPFCSGKRPSVTNRLDILHPDLALEWDEDANGGSPTVVAGSEKKAWWKCQHGHTWDAIIRSRTVLGSGCPKCAGVAMSKRRSTPRPGRSLQDLYPEVAAQWHPERNGARTPVDFAPQSNKLAWWRCEVGHEWEISPAGRIAKGGAGCPYCYGRFATETTSLAAQRPDIAAEWHPELNGTLTPNDVKPGTGKRAWWLCPKQHSYQSDIANRCFLDRGCPYEYVNSTWPH